jgi:leucyl-tRNA synthetase
MTYGTGAIMAVPAHDERDFEFAQTFGLELVQVIDDNGTAPRDSEGALVEAYCGSGALMHSADHDGMDSEGGQSSDPTTTRQRRLWPTND